MTNPIPPYLLGLIGTKPSAGHGTLWPDLIRRWQRLNPQEYPGAGPGMQMSVSSLITFTVIQLTFYVIE